MRCYASLRRRAEFARLRRYGRRAAGRTLTLYLADSLPRDPASLVGITVNKAIGKAVVRNKLRRRLAAIVNDALAQCGRTLRLVVVARPSAAHVDFATLRAEFATALQRNSNP